MVDFSEDVLSPEFTACFSFADIYKGKRTTSKRSIWNNQELQFPFITGGPIPSSRWKFYPHT
jgi:hypothetical protein